MKNKFKFIILAIIIIILLLPPIYQYFSGRTHFNDSFANGNSAGNLYNNGIFCEYQDTIYFSNPNDNHYLYSMDVHGGNLKKLTDDVASFINADGHYVYYVRNNTGTGSNFDFLHVNTNSLCRYDLKTGKILVLDANPSIYASLIGNYIYYIHYDTETASTLYRVKIDGSQKEQVDSSPYFTCSANGQYFYYNGIEKDHNIYQMDTSTGISNLICSGNYWMPSADNENIYFVDCENNYSLVKINRSSNSPISLGTDRIECYNVYKDTIYFQRNNLNGDAALCSMNTDGSNYQVIMEGNFTNINITSEYVYFSEVNNSNIIYRTPTMGNADISVLN